MFLQREIACEKSLQFQTINEGFQEKFEIFDDSLFKASKIFCEEILDELLFMVCKGFLFYFIF